MATTNNAMQLITGDDWQQWEKATGGGQVKSSGKNGFKGVYAEVPFEKAACGFVSRGLKIYAFTQAPKFSIKLT